MNKFTFSVLILFLILTSTSRGDSDCETKVKNEQTAIDNLAQSVSQVVGKSSNDPKVKIEAAGTYLMSIKNATDFSEEKTKNVINDLKPICDNESLDKKIRSKACTKLAGLNGMMAKKLRLDGVEFGKDAYHQLQLALNLDPNNTEATIGHAMAIVGLYESGFVIRKLAESKLSISASDEAQIAKKNMDRLKLQSNPVYNKLVDVL